MYYIVGIDEAGRGPLAGPVAVGVCAVLSTFDFTILDGIRDSKTLSEKQREEWYTRLVQASLTHSVALVGARIIDRDGIQRAIRLGLSRALRRVAVSYDSTVLLDGGLRAPERYKEQTTIIKGDSSEPLIAAAAILAKVTRDRYMLRQHLKYPQYGFDQHKGYGTAQHRAAIEQHGLTPLHRATFCHI